ncbi:hypothetical protein OEZ85_012610 [Tetradesmus obliquus]|uniref:SCP domain-containing protein n=1 Tax=Tetradesmus obliquus TaxID=3088 RepID=A0ABY8U779_TETOB|nr:hypothetical protein OEZ85_012610 [Tetradesmus obliquus]
MAISKSLSCAFAVLLFACCTIQARRLHEVGDVTSKTTIWLDPNGGVLPLSQRLELLAKANANQTAILLAEKHCKAHKYEGCKEVELLKAAGAKPAATGGEEVTAPCHQNMLASWFFGTYCELPTFDDPLKDPSKYKQPKAAAGKRRSLLSAVAARLQ